MSVFLCQALSGHRCHGGVGPRRYGLGLALVGEVAERHGGAVAAENAADGGAVIRIDLPAA